MDPMKIFSYIVINPVGKNNVIILKKELEESFLLVLTVNIFLLYLWKVKELFFHYILEKMSGPNFERSDYNIYCS